MVSTGRSRTAITTVFTIGHSTHSYDRFRQLLVSHGVSAIADVRSAPYSGRFPQFNREELKAELTADRIAYVYLGDLLGGRPKSRELFYRGAADYEAMAKLPAFRSGLDRVVEGSRKFAIALMCSERDPLECHRCLLVGRALAEREVRVEHILSDGHMCNHVNLEERLLASAGNAKEDFFMPREERLAAAYREQATRVAFHQPDDAFVERMP